MGQLQEDCVGINIPDQVEATSSIPPSSTPPSTPRVFLPTSPIPRNSPEKNESFRIPLGTEIFRKASLERKKTQIKFVSFFVIVLMTLILIGLVYFDPISNSGDQVRISQMVVVIGCLGLVLVSLVSWGVWKRVSREAPSRRLDSWNKAGYSNIM